MVPKQASSLKEESSANHSLVVVDVGQTEGPGCNVVPSSMAESVVKQFSSDQLEVARWTKGKGPMMVRKGISSEPIISMALVDAISYIFDKVKAMVANIDHLQKAVEDLMAKCTS